jgi:hypothetical protein
MTKDQKIIKGKGLGIFQSLYVIEFGVASIGQMLATRCRPAGIRHRPSSSLAPRVRGRGVWFFLPGLFLFLFQVAFPGGEPLLFLPERPGCEQIMSGAPRVVRFNVQCIFNRPEDELWSRPVSIA